MSNITLIIVIVVAVVVVVAIVIVGNQITRQRRTTQLREQYGPEYDRAVDLADSQTRRKPNCEAAPSGTNS